MTHGFLVAPVFDRIDERGRPYFSPDRPRLLGRGDRSRLLRYLREAPMVLRASGMERDPLASTAERVVPLHYRTDGDWVWQDACAYYLREYGVAPDERLVAHISASRFAVPASISNTVREAAGRAAITPPTATASAGHTADRRAARGHDPAGAPLRYFAAWDDASRDVAAPEEAGRGVPGAVALVTRLFRVWRPEETSREAVESLGPELTWLPSAEGTFPGQGGDASAGGENGSGSRRVPGCFHPVSERFASEVMNARWRAAAGGAVKRGLAADDGQR